MSLMRNTHAPHIDFTELYGISNKCVPSNVDMIYERNGYFLVAEWKRENELLSMGQSILLKQLAAQPKFVVLLVQGNTDNGMKVDEFWLIRSDGRRKSLGTSLDAFKRFIKWWFDEIAEKKHE